MKIAGPVTALTLLCTAAAAGPGSGDDADAPKARASLVSERTHLVAGEVNTLGLTLEIEPGWHVYWRGLNDTGFPIGADWTLPAGFEAGEMLWPAPKRYALPGDILDYVYEDRVTLLLPVRVPEGATAGETVTISADVNWLVCKSACIPEEATVTLSLPVARPGETVKAGEGARDIERARARLPKKLEPGHREVSKAWKGDTLTLGAEGAYEWIAFYPLDTSAAIKSPIKTGLSKAGPLRLTIDRDAVGDAARLTGVLEIKRSQAESGLYLVDEPIP